MKLPHLPSTDRADVELLVGLFFLVDVDREDIIVAFSACVAKSIDSVSVEFVVSESSSSRPQMVSTEDRSWVINFREMVEELTRLHTKHNRSPASLGPHRAYEFRQNLCILKKSRRQLVKLRYALSEVTVCPVQNPIIDGEPRRDFSFVKTRLKGHVENSNISGNDLPSDMQFSVLNIISGGPSTVYRRVTVWHKPIIVFYFFVPTRFVDLMYENLERRTIIETLIIYS